MTRFIAILLSMLLVVLPAVADEVEALDSILQLETVAVVAKHKPYQAVIPSQTLSERLDALTPLGWKSQMMFRPII